MRKGSPSVGGGSDLFWKPTAPTTCTEAQGGSSARESVRAGEPGGVVPAACSVQPRCARQGAGCWALQVRFDGKREGASSQWADISRAGCVEAGQQHAKQLGDSWAHLHGVHARPGLLAGENLPEHHTVAVPADGQMGLHTSAGQGRGDQQMARQDSVVNRRWCQDGTLAGQHAATHTSACSS